jgi:ADP-heptose:LPS heptosyltransferase
MLLDLARDLGAKPDGTTPDFFLTEEERENARDALRMRFGGRPVIGIHPGNFGNSCNLSPKVYGEVASRMLAGGRCGVVATGTASEKKLTDSWPRDVQDHPLFWNATGQWDIRQLAAHIASFAGLIVPSTGPLHIASALGIPAVSPFCASPSLSHVVWGGLSAGSVHLTPDAAYCRDRRKHHKGHCDFGGAISADKICDAAFRLAHLTEKYE